MGVTLGRLARALAASPDAAAPYPGCGADVRMPALPAGAKVSATSGTAAMPAFTAR